MCNVIARFPPHFFLRVLLHIASTATLHYSNYPAVNFKEVPCNHHKVRGYASRFNHDMKILLRPSWMHGVCDGRVARKGQMDTASNRTCSGFMAPKCQLLTRKRASVVLQDCMQIGSFPFTAPIFRIVSCHLFCHWRSCCLLYTSPSPRD